MKCDRVTRPRLRGTVCVLIVSLTLMVGGCGASGEEELSQFVMDFARGALAAWVL